MKRVQIHHPGLGKQAVVFEPAVKHHLRAGWQEGPLPDTPLQEPAPQGRIRTNLTSPTAAEAPPAPPTKPSSPKTTERKG